MCFSTGHRAQDDRRVPVCLDFLGCSDQSPASWDTPWSRANWNCWPFSQEGFLKGEEAAGQHVSLCLSPFCCTGCGLTGLQWVSRGLMGQALSPRTILACDVQAFLKAPLKC